MLFRSIFESLGKLYKKPASGGKEQRLTNLPEDVKELHPRFSRDRKTVVFATWDDSDLGAVHTVDLATGTVTTHTTKPGHYTNPALSRLKAII